MTIINAEWEIDEDGILTGKSYYHIHASRLTESANADSDGGYDWPVQIGKKANFSYALFIEAYRLALKNNVGKYKPALDEEVLEKSIELGRTFNDAYYGHKRRSS